MKFKNLTNHLKSVAIEKPDGSVRWYTAEAGQIIDIPDSERGRAIANGFVPLEQAPKGQEIKITSMEYVDLIPKPSKPKKKDELVSLLTKVKGIGGKVAEEIAEEYDSLEEIQKDIKSKKFSVGGIDKVKQAQILKL